MAKMRWFSEADVFNFTVKDERYRPRMYSIIFISNVVLGVQ
jgi:hypothetical protein